MILNKKAAMFGLDARIALAIFGALSVISGAALYSAIQDAKVTALLSDLNEFGKAYESYYLDTGIDINMHDSYSIVGADLVKDPGVNGWTGPYLSYPIHGGTSNFLSYTPVKDTWIYMIKLKQQDFTSGTVHPDQCTDVKECDMYVTIRAINEDSQPYLKTMAKELSLKIDGNDNLLTGNVRAMEISTVYNLYLKYMPAQSL
tara:strand:- start:8357 stop:8962 length:606 start_codon:yes stop_codon:yes gene_type:complete